MAASTRKSDKALFERAKTRIEEAKDWSREQHDRIREDLAFSNPADPQQWDKDAISARSGRPTLTLDRTNQFIQQVVNDARQSNPGVQVIGVDSHADPKAAETLGGLFRHIEYRSRAAHAYDTAIDLSARAGLGWLRYYPEVVDEASGEQEIRIARIVDPTAAGLDPNSTEVDGADAEWCYIETAYTQAAFERLYPKAKAVPLGSDTAWRVGDRVTVCEYFEVQRSTANEILAAGPDGEEIALAEDDYWTRYEAGEQLQVIETRRTEQRRIVWAKLTGAELLEQTEFPGEHLPLVPVLGSELWVDGKRYLCGLTRRLMDGQRLHNTQMSAVAEFLATQPKAPFMLPIEAVAGHEKHWDRLNRGNPAYLPYNHVDEQGNAIPMPQRVSPPPMPGAYAQMAQFAVDEMQAAVGMYKANLGQASNETSGRAIRARQMEGDTATFHFIDNLSRAIEHMARGIISMIPRIYTSARIAQIVGVDGERKQVRIAPMGPAAMTDRAGQVVAINPSVGRYDVRVRTGPSYTTQREETAQQLADMIQAQPQLAPILGPMWARLKDMPEGERIARLLLAMAPPQVQQIEQDGADAPIPPQVQARLQQAEQQAQAMQQAMDQATQEIARLRAEVEGKRIDAIVKAAELEIREYDAETKRLQVMGAGMTVEQVQGVVLQLLADLQRQNVRPAQPEPIEQPEPVPELPEQQPGSEMPAEPTDTLLEFVPPTDTGPDLGPADPMNEGEDA